jgi:hypothetical protein
VARRSALFWVVATILALIVIAFFLQRAVSPGETTKRTTTTYGASATSEFSTAGVAWCPRAGDRNPESFDAKRIEGKTLSRGRVIAHRHGCTIRVVRLNGKRQAGFLDLRRNRINVAVADGRIKWVGRVA